MEDENGLELSLGLGCGGSSSKSKSKVGSFSDDRTEEVDRSNRVVDDFKNFLHATAKQQNSASCRSQKNDLTNPPENLFNNLTRSLEVEEEKSSTASKKRKMLEERDAVHANLRAKKASLMSIITDDGSSAENEDVAESEVEGSTSRLSSLLEDSSKQFNAVHRPSKIPNNAHGVSDSGKKKHDGSTENECKPGNFTFGVPFSGQPVNIMGIPYSFALKDSTGAHTSSSSSHPLIGMTQVVPAPNGEQRAGAQSASPGILPFMFGYSSVQLPTLDVDNSRGLVSNPQQFRPSFVGKGPPNSGSQGFGRNSTEATLETMEGDGKRHIMGEGLSSQTEDDAKGGSINLRAKTPSEQLTMENVSLDLSAIRPGITADLKFGGCGSYPNLPWVSTTAPGPNGRTISGVTYRYSATQIRIVCACHGSHMSPEEFLQHASEENGNPNSGSGLASFSNTNHSTSAQS